MSDTLRNVVPLEINCATSSPLRISLSVFPINLNGTQMQNHSVEDVSIQLKTPEVAFHDGKTEVFTTVDLRSFKKN